MARWSYGGFAPYVSVAERQRRAQAELEKLRKKGHPVSPVVIEGRKIATSFWGKAWCENLEGYADFASRLGRGRTYVRNGSVVDLQVAAGEVEARVAGSALYRTRVTVKAVPAPRWAALRRDCAGGIDSLVELLQGRLSQAVMERICRREEGLFPTPREIDFDCSCPDFASMCKHVAAVLYGIGARLDEAPELLFTLRAVDHGELIAHVAKDLPLATRALDARRVLPSDGLAELFGLDLVMEVALPAEEPAAAAKTAVKAAAKTAAKGQGRVAARKPAAVAAKAPAATAAKASVATAAKAPAKPRTKVSATRGTPAPAATGARR
ncbi:MAG TPA: SWIM zinc finger family protein [Kofleriaceae bacterium]|nr:SWIM zinc finger family protein [Kofleriaceae bacterium]